MLMQEPTEEMIYDELIAFSGLDEIDIKSCTIYEMQREV